MRKCEIVGMSYQSRVSVEYCKKTGWSTDEYQEGEVNVRERRGADCVDEDGFDKLRKINTNTMIEIDDKESEGMNAQRNVMRTKKRSAYIAIESHS